MTFPIFWLILISFFYPNHVKPFFVEIQCKITIMMIIIIINVKNLLERHFLWDFNEKKVVLQITTLMHYEARQVLRDLFSTNKGNGSDMTFVVGATKISLKNVKT